MAYTFSSAGLVKAVQDSVNNGTLKIAKFVFDAGVTANRTIGAHGTGIKIPGGSLVLGGMITVDTAFKSGTTDAATIAIHVESAGDIKAAATAASGYTTGKKAIVPKINTPESTSILLTEEREITCTVAEEALTAGKLHGFLIYVAP